MIDAKEIARLREQSSFLGYEFLTWLFLLLDQDAKEELEAITKDLLHKTEVIITLGSSITTCVLNHKEQKTVVRSPILEESHEVFASIRNGHLVESLALNLYFQEISVLVILNALDFSLTQIKIKNNFESLKEEDSLDEQDKVREEIFLRMALLEDTEKVLDALYGYYLKLKSQPKDFSKITEKLKSQIENRLGHYLRIDRAEITKAESPVI
jgi:hypothetical protein